LFKAIYSALDELDEYKTTHTRITGNPKREQLQDVDGVALREAVWIVICAIIILFIALKREEGISGGDVKLGGSVGFAIFYILLYNSRDDSSMKILVCERLYPLS